MKVLSVTVPAYNAEAFLQRGIRTMLDERIMEAVEIIIVDDGSTDRTAEMADRYHVEYPNTVRVIHKENGGHGSGINSGIGVATGRYFCVMDADDWVDTENFVRLVQYMKGCSSDLILADQVLVDDEDQKIDDWKKRGLPEGTIGGGVPACQEVLLDDYIGRTDFRVGIHNCFISSDILRENKIKCHEHCYYVDAEYVLYPLLYVKTVTYVDYVVYHYWIGREGQSVSANGRKKHWEHCLRVSSWLIDFYEQNLSVMSKSQKEYYQRYIAGEIIYGVYGVLLSLGETEKKAIMVQYDRYLQEKSKDMYAYGNKNLELRLLRKSHFTLYRIAALAYRIVKAGI